MPEKGHTHNTRDRRKQLERNERKQEQNKNKNNNSNYNTIKIPQNETQFIVAINEKIAYRGGTTVNVIFSNGTHALVFIPGKCRLNKRRKQNINKKEYLFVEKIDIKIYSSASCTYSLIHAYTEEDMKELKKKENKNEFWYWRKWEEECNNYDNNDDDNDDNDNDKNDDNNSVSSNNDTPSDINIDNI